MFEIGKTYKTRDKRDAMLVHVFDDSSHLWVDGSNHWTTCPDGHYFGHDSGHQLDVIPPVKVGYFNIYVAPYESRKAADAAAFGNRIGCIRVEYRDGQYDD